jgi:hypothetical protein
LNMVHITIAGPAYNLVFEKEKFDAIEPDLASLASQYSGPAGFTDDYIFVYRHSIFRVARLPTRGCTDECPTVFSIKQGDGKFASLVLNCKQGGSFRYFRSVWSFSWPGASPFSITAYCMNSRVSIGYSERAFIVKDWGPADKG